MAPVDYQSPHGLYHDLFPYGQEKKNVPEVAQAAPSGGRPPATGQPAGTTVQVVEDCDLVLCPVHGLPREKVPEDPEHLDVACHAPSDEKEWQDASEWWKRKATEESTLPDAKTTPSAFPPHPGRRDQETEQRMTTGSEPVGR